MKTTAGFTDIELLELFENTTHDNNERYLYSFSDKVMYIAKELNVNPIGIGEKINKLLLKDNH